MSTTEDKVYYYKVRAYKEVGEKKIYGPWSSVVKFTLPHIHSYNSDHMCSCGVMDDEFIKDYLDGMLNGTASSSGTYAGSQY